MFSEKLKAELTDLTTKFANGIVAALNAMALAGFDTSKPKPPRKPKPVKPKSFEDPEETRLDKTPSFMHDVRPQYTSEDKLRRYRSTDKRRPEIRVIVAESNTHVWFDRTTSIPVSRERLQKRFVRIV